MASHNGDGYLIPDNPQPDELNCLLVFYPDDPGYLAVLLGSLTYLGTWAAWEREPDKRGRLSAAAWKEANECTLSSMSCVTDLVNALTGINQTLALIQAAIENQQISLDAGEFIPALTGIQTAIENQELNCNCGMSEDDMSITINNCCCCGGQSSAPVAIEYPPDYQPITPPPNDDDNDPNDYYVNSAMCAYAQYLWVKWRGVIIAACDGSLTLSNIIDYLSTTFDDTTSIIQWAVTNFNDLITYLGVYLAGVIGYAGQAATEIDSKKDAILCALLNESSVNTKISQAGIIIDTMALPAAVRNYAKAVFALLPLGPLNDGYIASGAGGVPQWAYAAGCPGCVDPVPDPEPSNLYLRDHTSTQGQLWLSQTGSNFSQVGTTGVAFDFFRKYYIKGDVANHCDAEISADDDTSNRVDCLVMIKNENLAPMTINLQAGGQAGSVTLQAGEEQEVVTSLLDFNVAITNAVISVVISPNE